MLRVNIDGTANMVNIAMQAGVKKFCHISSIATLGFTTDGKLIDENVWWKNDPANSWYAISKYGAEREAWRASEETEQAIEQHCQGHDREQPCIAQDQQPGAVEVARLGREPEGQTHELAGLFEEERQIRRPDQQGEQSGAEKEKEVA